MEQYDSRRHERTRVVEEILAFDQLSPIQQNHCINIYISNSIAPALPLGLFILFTNNFFLHSKFFFKLFFILFHPTFPSVFHSISWLLFFYFLRTTMFTQEIVAPVHNCTILMVPFAECKKMC